MVDEAIDDRCDVVVCEDGAPPAQLDAGDDDEVVGFVGVEDESEKESGR